MLVLRSVRTLQPYLKNMISLSQRMTMTMIKSSGAEEQKEESH